MPSNIIELTDVLNPHAFRTLKKGQTLGFKQGDGSIVHYKIIRLNKTRMTAWGEKTKLYTQKEMQAEWEKKRNAKN